VLGLANYSDLHTALQDEHLRDLLGLKKPPSERTISRAHEELHPRIIKHTYNDWVKQLVHEQKLKGNLIAIDSTFLVTYGKTYERTAYSYKPKGKKGYRLTIAYDCDSNLPICFLLASANRSDSKMLTRTVAEVERFLPPNPQRIYLFDKGYWKGANFNHLDKQNIRFITQVKWYPKITKTLEQVFSSTPLQVHEQREITINENQQEVSDFEKKLRVVALVGRRAKQLFKQEANKEDPDDNRDEVKSKKTRPFCLLTNVWDVPVKRIVQYYERRWAIEQFIRQSKQTWPLGVFCNTDHNAIKTHIWLLFYSYSLIQLFRQEVMSQSGVSHCAVKWLRKELFIRSGLLHPSLTNGLTITFSHKRSIDKDILPRLLATLAAIRRAFISSLFFLYLIVLSEYSEFPPDSDSMTILILLFILEFFISNNLIGISRRFFVNYATKT
jgi:hypothetical protein